jgi:cytochrome c peroxidase
MHRVTTARRLAAGLAITLGAGACAAPDRQLTARDGVSQVELGEALFTSETFDGNGRTCATCHILENFGTLTPEIVQAKYEANPNDPLFRAIDSDDGTGASYTRLLETATIRVPILLQPRPDHGLAVRRCDAPADTIIWVNRGNPSVFNIALEEHLMVDGRDGSSLEIQAHNAIHTHAEPGREPTVEELAAIAAFQETLYSHEAIRAFRDSRDRGTLGLPEPTTEQEARGREFFNEDRQCGTCHSGPMLNETTASHPDGAGIRFESALVGLNPNNPNQKYFWCWVDPATNEVTLGPNFDVMTTWAATSDPGIGLQDMTFPYPEHGVPGHLTSEDIFAGVPSFFKIPTLWGTPNTAPYFHDNSAMDLAAVMDHYNVMFANLPSAFEIGCEPRTDECLSEQDRADIIAYMQLFSFENIVESANAAGARPQAQ